jgi:ppGpp synthetase/RelA/SpoT-type nucleotidyltranferase
MDTLVFNVSCIDGNKKYFNQKKMHQLFKRVPFVKNRLKSMDSKLHKIARKYATIKIPRDKTLNNLGKWLGLDIYIEVIK